MSERPFNQPESWLGKWLFGLISWMERRVRAASRVGSGPFFDQAEFPWLPNLQSKWLEIRAKAETVLLRREHLPAFQEISTDVGYITISFDPVAGRSAC